MAITMYACDYFKWLTSQFQMRFNGPAFYFPLPTVSGFGIGFYIFLCSLYSLQMQVILLLLSLTLPAGFVCG